MLEMRSGQNPGNNQQVTYHGHDSVNANCTMAGRPGKHQQPENRHELIRPHKSGHSKDQVHLHNQVENQIFHRGDDLGEGEILLQLRV